MWQNNDYLRLHRNNYSFLMDRVEYYRERWKLFFFPVVVRASESQLLQWFLVEVLESWMSGPKIVMSGNQNLDFEKSLNSNVMCLVSSLICIKKPVSEDHL